MKKDHNFIEEEPRERWIMIYQKYSISLIVGSDLWNVWSSTVLLDPYFKHLLSSPRARWTILIFLHFEHFYMWTIFDMEILSSCWKHKKYLKESEKCQNLRRRKYLSMKFLNLKNVWNSSIISSSIFFVLIRFDAIVRCFLSANQTPAGWTPDRPRDTSTHLASRRC